MLTGDVWSAAKEAPDLSLRLCEDCGAVPEGVFPLRVAEQVEQATGWHHRCQICVLSFPFWHADVKQERYTSFNRVVYVNSNKAWLTGVCPTNGKERLQEPRLRLIRAKVRAGTRWQDPLGICWIHGLQGYNWVSFWSGGLNKQGPWGHRQMEVGYAYTCWVGTELHMTGERPPGARQGEAGLGVGGEREWVWIVVGSPVLTASLPENSNTISTIRSCARSPDRLSLYHTFYQQKLRRTGRT